MTIYLHCDGPGCDEQATEREAEFLITTSGRTYVKGWLSLDYGADYHFHDYRCLSTWAASR